MRKVMAFLVWLFSFWTWKDFFLRWLRRPPFHPASGETAGLEHLSSQEGPPESELARFLSSSPKDERWCRGLTFYEDSTVELDFGSHQRGYLSDMREFLEAIASSKLVFREDLELTSRRENDSLKQVEALADALRQSGTAIRKLKLRCLNVSAIPFAECVSSSLLGNDAVQDLHIDMRSLEGKTGKEVVEEFMGIFAVPHILRILKSFQLHASDFGDQGMEELMKPFKSPDSVLEELRIKCTPSDAELEHISGLLVASTSLKKLYLLSGLHKKNTCPNGYTTIASALCSNRSLQLLQCEISSSMELKALLDPLMPKTNNLQPNITLIKLYLSGTMGGREGIETLVHMLRTNMSLLRIAFSNIEEFQSKDAEASENVLATLEALKTNKSLKKIYFRSCSAIGGSKVLGAMMDLLLENHCIEDIDFMDTPLEVSGDVEYVKSALSKRKKMKLWNIVQGMANVKPTSGRVFLCGQPFAGKTRLRLSMKKLKEFQEKDEVQNASRLGNVMPIAWWRARKRQKVPMVQEENMPLERTQGIEVDNVLCDGIRISIWDMAGQTDYHSFHELVMPNFSADGSCAIFLLMCDPMERLDPTKRRSLTSIKVELESWLRFIASNTRRSNSYCPHVSIVMTHFDNWKTHGQFAACIEDEVTKLRLQFKEVLEFDGDKIVFKVNGHDGLDAQKVFDFIKSHLKQLLERLPQTISACEQVQRLVVQWNADNSKSPLLKWDEFCQCMCEDVEDFNIANHELAERRKEFVAVSLNEGGHIIFNEKEGVVITNPHWFCHHIMGQFLHQCSNEGCHLDMVLSNGVISIAHVKRFMLDVIPKEGDVDKKFEDILGMMKKLHICYEQDKHNILIPSTLKDTNATLSWSEIDGLMSFKYVGKRLACQDGLKTMLTIGFFTRLQVSLFKTLQNTNDQHTYKVFRDVIKFITDGIEVILQFNHGDIDILARSNESQDKMLAFLELDIIDHIKHLQEDPTLGCPGVRLTQYILRPECVKKLLSPMDRKTQVVHVKDLEVEVMNYGANAKHSWRSCEGLDIGYHTVKTLLGHVAYHNLLLKRTRMLQNYYKEIQSLDSSTQNDPFFHNHNIGDESTTIYWQLPWNRRYGALDVKLDNIIQMQKQHQEEIMSKLDTVVEKIQSLEHGMKDMQKELLDKVCSRIDDLMEFSMEMKSSQIPKVAYLSEIGSPKLLMRFVPGLDRIKLHLMCESKHGFHQVANQQGCVVHFGTEDTRRFLAMITYGLKIVTILTKIGAHVACGMGAMVPDFSNGCNFAALVFDSPGFLDYQIPTTTLESLPLEARNVSRLSIDDTSEVQRWLRSFLEPKCENKREFYKTFELTKVKYRSSERRSVSWICDKCLAKLDDPKDVLT